jgi:N utilization substance protein B
MISRRLLRIKALMELYAYNRRGDDDMVRAETELMFSIGKTYDLYHYVLLLVIDMADIAEEKIQQSLLKKMPSHEDLNPNRRFVDNIVVSHLRDNLSFKKHISESKLSWINYPHIPRQLYQDMTRWDVYKDYVSLEKSDYQTDKKFIIKLVTEYFLNSEELLNCLEEQSIYWNDDIEYVTLMVEKTLKKFRPDSGDKTLMMPLFKNKEDEDFVRLLFRKAVLHTKECSDLIDNNTTNWEVERIALMDILVMQLAITEVLEFPEIPVKVTLNEYIEIAKYYCTSKSSTFVNGILDNIVKEMSEKALFKKKGRGLLEE